MTRPAFTTVADLASAYRSDAVTPLEMVAACLERIESLDPLLNAFAAVLADSAVEAAERATEELSRGIDHGPLHGVPVAIKDLMAVKDAPTGFGSLVGRIASAPTDAVLVARLREAGAIPIGKTNLLEYAYGVVHPDIGPTANPWDPSRTAGGSSGGSAAAVAAGLVPLAIGTDTGGSIRIPASYCGIVGLKPTWGRLPLEGVFPLSWSLDAAGPLARNASDALTLFRVLDGGEGTAEPRGRLEGATLGVPWGYIESTRLEPPVLASFERAVDAARTNGAKIVDFNFDEFATANQLLLDILLPEASVIHEKYIREERDGYAPGTRSQIERGFELPAVAYVRARRAQEQLRTRFSEAMNGLDAVFTPSVPYPAPAEDPAVEGEEGAAEMHFSGPFNLLGGPAVSIPFGSTGGLPVGVQLAGRLGGDEEVLSLASGLEELAPALPPLPAPVRRAED